MVTEAGGSGANTGSAGAPSLEGGADTGGATSGGRGNGGAIATGGVNAGGTDGGASPDETGGTSSGGKASGGTTPGGSTASGGKGGSGGTAAQGGSAGKGGSGGTATSGGTGGTGATGGTGGSGGKGGSGGTVAQGGSSGVGGACASGGAGTLFFDNFECGTQAWTPSPTAAFALVTDGSNTYTAGKLASTLALSSAGSSTWSNVLIEVKVKALSFGDAAGGPTVMIYGRYVDASHYMAIAWRGDGTVGLLQRNNGGGDVYDPEPLLTTGEWYTLGLELKNDSARVFINGVLNKATLQNPITSGRVALSVQNATARFDDVRVTALP